MQKTRQKLVCRKNLRTPSPSKHPRLLLFLPESRRFQHFHQSFAVTFLTGLTLFTWGKRILSFPGVHFTPASVFPPLISRSRSSPCRSRGWRSCPDPLTGTGQGWGWLPGFGLVRGQRCRSLCAPCAPARRVLLQQGREARERGGNAERCIETLRKTFRAGARGRMWS